MALTKSRARMIMGAMPSVLDRNADNTGATDSKTNLLSVATVSPKGFPLPSGTYRLSTDTVFSPAVSFDPGAVVRPDAGVKVTFSNGVVSGLYQIFDCGLTGAEIRGVRVACPEWWGAVRNGVADDSVAINRALSCVGLAGGGEVLLSAGVYAIFSKLIIPAGVKLRGRGREATILRVNSLSLTAVEIV